MLVPLELKRSRCSRSNMRFREGGAEWLGRQRRGFLNSNYGSKPQTGTSTVFGSGTGVSQQGVRGSSNSSSSSSSGGGLEAPDRSGNSISSSNSSSSRKRLDGKWEGAPTYPFGWGGTRRTNAVSKSLARS